MRLIADLTFIADLLTVDAKVNANNRFRFNASRQVRGALSGRFDPWSRRCKRYHLGPLSVPITMSALGQ
jgi:hypothetical protein